LALTPQNNDAFFREVDEQLRAEQLASFWHRYGRFVLLAVGLGLALFAGFLWWQNHRAAQAGQDSEALSAVLTDLGAGKKAGAKAKLDAIAKSPRQGYSVTARLTSAAMALEAGDTKGAAAQFKTIAEDSSVPQPFRDLALIRQTATEYDTLPPAQVIARLKPLAVAGNPWFGSAGEMVAVAHIKMNQPAQAATIFGAMAKSVDLPETLRSRASRMAGALGVDTVAEPRAAGKE